MIDSTPWAVVAAVLCLGTGITCLALAAAAVGDRAAQLTHAVMGLAMAGMFSPWGDPVPGWIGAVLFTVLGAWFVAAALSRHRIGRAAHHLAISSVAMVLMYLMNHHAGGASGTAGSGAHAGHAMAGGGTASLLVMPLALVLAGYFVWHTWTCVERCRSAVAPCSTGSETGAIAGRTSARNTARIEPVAHGVMSALMAAMFLSAI
jgi:putative Mn2+ efflux pump MntP